jgi:hypothetical protein
MKVPESFETLGTTYPTTKHHTPKGLNPMSEQDAAETQKLCATQNILKTTKFITYDFVLKQFIFRSYTNCI